MFKPSSHMLRHALDQHEGETLTRITFVMEVIKYTRTSFDRQILESICIQQNINHNILNSKSEYNRCFLPRLSTRLGDKEYKKYGQEQEMVRRREESLEMRIRDMRKTRNKSRKSRIKQTNPLAKRRETGDEIFSRVCAGWATEITEQELSSDKNETEKRKQGPKTPAA